MKIVKIAVIFAAVAILSSCASVGKINGQSTNTQVNLSSSNYKLVKTEITGESSGFYLLGLIPVKSPCYSEAKNDLYRNVGSSLVGRPVAFANQTEDISSMYFFLFSRPKITITADLIEFTNTSETP